MAQHDYVIANQTAANLRADLNNVLQAIVTQNAGSTAPADTFANMLWYDTANNQIKKRNEGNTAWITLGTIDEGSGKFTPNAAITTSEIAAATLVTASETIGSNNNDTTIPTSAAVKAYADGAASFNEDGYANLPGGLQVRWGTETSTSDNPETFNFASAFSTACRFAIVQRTQGGSTIPIPVTGFTASGFTIDRPDSIDGNQDITYFALGY